jgi:hypothetical protein
VVLGEFDLTGHSEPNTPVEKNVKRVVVHRDYVERTFENDLAILELETPVEFKPYIVPICLPSTSDGDFVGQKAEVTGWGKLSHSNTHLNICNCIWLVSSSLYFRWTNTRSLVRSRRAYYE